MFGRDDNELELKSLRLLTEGHILPAKAIKQAKPYRIGAKYQNSCSNFLLAEESCMVSCGSSHF